MNQTDPYIVDWPVSEHDLSPNAAVCVSTESRVVGLYRVRQLGTGTMTLSHGGISFPVGTQLVVEDFQKLLPTKMGTVSARVIGNDTRGIQLAW